MDYTNYYKARNTVAEILSKDWLGPVENEEIICDERPLDYYILGKLYPQESVVAEEQASPSEDCGNLDNELTVTLSNSHNPSSFGLSFSLNAHIKTILLNFKAAQYKLIDRLEAQSALGFDDKVYKPKAYFWQRFELDIPNIEIDIDHLINCKSLKLDLSEGIQARIILHKNYPDKSKTISVTMININSATGDYKDDCLAAVFQPKILVTANDDNAFGDVRRNVNFDKDNLETLELSMLYHKVGNYASGHGCAVNWETDDAGNVQKLYTEFLPDYELKQMMPTQSFKNKVLQMKFLSDASFDEISEGFAQLINEYNKWILKLEKDIKHIPESFNEIALTNVEKCKTCMETLKESLKELKDEKVLRAFKLANYAMLLQRKQSLLNKKQFVSEEKITWYPFQIAFFLQEVISISNPHSPQRENVDLLWFPTGGGKTEAYLGIAAFTIFLRRLRNPDNSNGVTVLMRYTLRLLSFQQFERAAALICACEIIRIEQGIPGGEIGIGLWAGMALTPNKISVAAKILRGEKDEDSPSSNPAQFEKCPWCGKPIPKENYNCNDDKKRMYIKCSDGKCHFHQALPIYLIDEEIYQHTPNFVISTVDKFAQISLNSKTSNLFGKHRGFLPPELIIQDELHLISGPLGTITGLYEVAIKKLCEQNGIYPKIVASTATIRNAEHQIKGLYAANYTQFPPQGIDINDSFFAQVSNKEEKPARLYLGCMAVGTSPTTMMIRVMASLLYATRYLAEQGYDDEIVNSFWTLTGYFNTLRELGGAIIRVIDDIQDRFTYLKTGKFNKTYPLHSDKKRYDRYKELTSREKSENIGNVIQKELQEPYTSDGSTNPYDFLLSSNMISVGVDIDRLGIMTVVGQPKTTSEYIQATSRVGRSTPGLVVATYNQSKSRDRSHYEDFLQYHSTFYKFVESTSVTPFSDRARARALQSVYVALCRNSIPELFLDKGAVNFRADLPQLKSIREYILSYVSAVDPDEITKVEEDLNEIENEWENKVLRDGRLKYRKTKYIKQSEALFTPDYNEDDRFRVLNSMRSVETSIKVTIYE